MATPAKAAPEFRAAATPYLSIKGASAAIEFYKKAFGAEEVLRLMQPDGRVGHAEINISGARIMLADEFPEIGFLSPESLGGSPVHIHLDVADVDAVARQAIAAGATVVRPVADQFYGDRSGQLRDPFGYSWTVSTHKEAMSGREMQRRIDAMSEQESAAPPAKYIREGFHSITPYLILAGAAQWIEFVKQAFGAEEKFRVGRPGQENVIMHAEVKIGDSMVELADANPQFPAMPCTLLLRVDNPDEVYNRAVEAGATSMESVSDKEYGSRGGTVVDPSGNRLHISKPFGPGNEIFGAFRSVTPHLYAERPVDLMEFLKQAFGGEEIYRAQMPDGSIPHAQIRIGDSIVALAGGHGMYTAMPSTLHLYAPDTDATYEQAIRVGATSIQPPADQPYGERNAGVRDPFGNRWFIATRLRDVQP
ncbi:MAG TPA: VOC family protein [Candidatus Bathyarchaeia archaeon]|nr:VOC family protein [Candidatus Bathyarchaeia archaeon]